MKLHHWKKSCQGVGVPIKQNKCWFSLNYVNDKVIILQGPENLEYVLKRLNTTYPTTHTSKNIKSQSFSSTKRPIML